MNHLPVGMVHAFFINGKLHTSLPLLVRQALASSVYSVAAVKLSNLQVSGSVVASRRHVLPPFSSTVKKVAFDDSWGTTVASRVVVEVDTMTRSLGPERGEQ